LAQKLGLEGRKVWPKFSVNKKSIQEMARELQMLLS